MVEINVGTGLSKHINKDEEIASFTTENMIEGKTYDISVTSIGSGDYKDSDIESISFVYSKPVIESEEEVNVE